MGVLAGALSLGVLARRWLLLPKVVVVAGLAPAIVGLWWFLSIVPLAVDWLVLGSALVLAAWPRKGLSVWTRVVLLLAVGVGLLVSTPYRRSAPLDSSVLEVFMRYERLPPDYDRIFFGYSLVSKGESVAGRHMRLAPTRCHTSRQVWFSQVYMAKVECY